MHADSQTSRQPDIPAYTQAGGLAYRQADRQARGSRTGSFRRLTDIKAHTQTERNQACAMRGVLARVKAEQGGAEAQKRGRC